MFDRLKQYVGDSNVFVETIDDMAVEFISKRLPPPAKSTHCEEEEEQENDDDEEEENENEESPEVVLDEEMDEIRWIGDDRCRVIVVSKAEWFSKNGIPSDNQTNKKGSSPMFDDNCMLIYHSVSNPVSAHQLEFFDQPKPQPLVVEHVFLREVVHQLMNRNTSNKWIAIKEFTKKYSTDKTLEGSEDEHFSVLVEFLAALIQDKLAEKRPKQD